MKAERVTDGHNITDTLNGKNFIHGQKYMVTFPDGARKKMSCIVLKQVIVQENTPMMVMREQAFFSIRHHGLDDVWVRAIDLPNIRIIKEDGSTTPGTGVMGPPPDATILPAKAKK